MRPHQWHRLPPLAQDDHLAVAPGLDGDGPPPPRGLALERLIIGVEAEVDHRAGAVATHRLHVWIVRVEDRRSTARHGFHDHLLDVGKLPHGGDPA